MPYNKDIQRILSGSLNLLPPGTEIPDHDAQNLQNLTYDAAGNLRVRKGHVLVCTAAGRVVRLLKALGARWQAAGGAVQKDCATIIGGMSADAVGLVGFKKYLWAMSRARQRKSNGTDDWRWIPEAPTTKAITKTAPEVTKEVVDFTGGFTVDPTPFVLDYRPTLHIRNEDGREVYSAEKDISVDLGTDQDLDDIHRITVWSAKWHNIEEVIFEVDVNDGTFTKDYYRARMRPRLIRTARKETIVLHIRKRPQNVDVAAKDKKRYIWFERVGQTADKDWRSAVKVRIKIDFKDAGRIRFDKWEVVGDKDNTIEGDDIQYYYTWTTADEHESNPSPVSDPITVNRGSVEISDMEISADPQVTGKHIYRTGGTLGAVLRITEEPIADVATFTDTKGDDFLTDLGISMEIDHDDPPPAAGLAGPYYNRLLAYSSAEHPARLWWSRQNKPYAFPGADDEFGSWVDIGETDEAIMHVTLRPHMAYIYKENSLWIMTGDPDDLGGENHESAAQMGISSRNGAVKGGAVDYAHMSEGIYLVAGESAVKISGVIDPIFKGRSVEVAPGLVFQPISDVTTTAMGYRDNVVWFSYDTAGGRKTLKYDVATSRWFNDSRGFTAFYYEGQSGDFLGGQDSGDVLALERGASDNGAAIAVDYFSKYYDQGVRDVDKNYEDLTVEFNGQSLLTASAYLNYGAVVVALGNIGGGRGREVFAMNGGLGRDARNIAVRITGSVTSADEINSLAVNFYPEARQGKSYDTDTFDAGTHLMKRIREVYLDLQNTSSVQILLHTDQPGFQMVLRDNLGIIGAATERRGEAHVFFAERLGREMRIVLTGADFRLYGLRALIQVIGTYLHGSRSEFWRSDPVDFGTERVKLFKEIEVVYDSAGPVLVKVEVDLPGGILAEIAGSPFALPATTGEQTRKVRLPGIIKGRLLQVTVTPQAANDVRLEAVRIFTKQIGEPGATPWAWVPLPVQPTQDAQWVDLFTPRDDVG